MRPTHREVPALLNDTANAARAGEVDAAGTIARAAAELQRQHLGLQEMTNFFQLPNYRETTRTAYDLREAAKAVRAALDEFAPNASKIAVGKLLAQAMFETSDFHHCYNHNWGNVKRNPATGKPFQMMRCNEIIGGHAKWFDPPDIQTCFLAEDTAADGAREWMSLILTRDRYLSAKTALLDDSCNAHRFAWELGACGYYTASQRVYSEGVQDNYPVAMLAIQGRRVLRVGMDGDDVKEWQRFIGADPNGQFGPKTLALTEEVQRGHRLKPDGVVGPVSWGIV